LLAYCALVILSPKTITYPPEDCWYITPEEQNERIRLPELDHPPTLDLSVIVPAYNEASRIVPMLEAAAKHLQSIPSRSSEIIVVDDGSRDNTAGVVLAAVSTLPACNVRTRKFDLRVISLSKNRGKGAAVKHGFLHARGRRLLMVDADGASQFSDLELLWRALDEIDVGGHAVAVGSRAYLVDTDAVVKRSFIRNLLMRGLHLCLKTLGVGHIRDTQCGFKLFTRESARLLFPPMHIAHWIFDVELLILAHMLGIPVAEVPIAWHEVQGSKINLISDSISMLRDLIILRSNYAIGRWTIRRRLKAE